MGRERRMYSVYCNRTTPFFAFLEGMVRMFDWAALIELRRYRSKKEEEPEIQDDGWSDRIVDWYIRDSIATFEVSEAESLRQVPILPRRSFAVADVVLGPMPMQDVILCYEELVPGACDTIMQRASDKLKDDGQAEIELLKERARQGYMGMGASFLLTVFLMFGAFFLSLSGNYWAALSLVAVIFALVISASAYVTKARVRRKFYTNEFFFRRSRPTLIY